MSFRTNTPGAITKALPRAKRASCIRFNLIRSMPTNLDAQLIDNGPAFETLGLVHRVRTPAGPGPHPTLVMIHGLKGNEDVTWIFARSASPNWLIVAPRAPFAAGDSSYSWVPDDNHDYDHPETLQAGL